MESVEPDVRVQLSPPNGGHPVVRFEPVSNVECGS